MINEIFKIRPISFRIVSTGIEDKLIHKNHFSFYSFRIILLFNLLCGIVCRGRQFFGRP